MPTTPKPLRSALRIAAALLWLPLAGTLWAEKPAPPDEPEAPSTEEAPKASGSDNAVQEEKSAPPAPDRTPKPSQTSAGEDRGQRPKPRLQAQTDRFSWAQMDPKRQEWTGEPISLSLRDADLVEVLRSFGKMTDINLVIDPSVQGKVTVELKNVPWDQALYVILKSNGLGMEVDGNVLSMLPVEKLYRDR